MQVLRHLIHKLWWPGREVEYDVIIVVEDGLGLNMISNQKAILHLVGILLQAPHLRRHDNRLHIYVVIKTTSSSTTEYLY